MSEDDGADIHKEGDSGERSRSNSPSRSAFSKAMSLFAYDNGSSMRGTLHKKGRAKNHMVRPWNERFFVLDYTDYTLSYFDLSR